MAKYQKYFVKEEKSIGLVQRFNTFNFTNQCYHSSKVHTTLVIVVPLVAESTFALYSVYNNIFKLPNMKSVDNLCRVQDKIYFTVYKPVWSLKRLYEQTD